VFSLFEAFRKVPIMRACHHCSGFPLRLLPNIGSETSDIALQIDYMVFEIIEEENDHSYRTIQADHVVF